MYGSKPKHLTTELGIDVHFLRITNIFQGENLNSCKEVLIQVTILLNPLCFYQFSKTWPQTKAIGKQMMSKLVNNEEILSVHLKKETVSEERLLSVLQNFQRLWKRKNLHFFPPCYLFLCFSLWAICK